jgi:polysaccharide transporter, PST family
MSFNKTWIQLLPPTLRDKLDGHHTLQKVLVNTVWLFADRILRMGVALFVGVWIARYLGPMQFGLFNYATAFAYLLSPFASLGLDGIVVRNIIQKPDDRNEILGTAFTLKLIGAITTLLLGIGLVTWLRPGDDLTRWLVAIIAAGTIFQAFEAIDFWFQSQIQSKYSVYARNLAFILITLVKVVLLQLKAPLIAFAWAGLAEVVLSAVGLIFVYQFQGNSLFRWKFDFSCAKSLLKDSWPLILSGIAIVIYMKIDQLMLGEMMGDDAVGIYSAATRISEVWYFIPMLITSSVSPTIVEAKQISEELFRQRTQRLLNIMAGSSILLAISMTFISKPLILTLYGAEYSGSILILIVHIWSAPFVFLGVGASPWITVENLFRRSLITTVIGGISNILLNLYLIPLYSALGAAVATLISYAMASYLLNFFVFKNYPIFGMQTKACLSIFNGKLWKD